MPARPMSDPEPQSNRAERVRDAKPQTLNSIQILRFAAAFSVVLFHARITQVLAFGSDTVGADRAFKIGASGVHLFFLISGFVMVLTAFLRERPMPSRTFLGRRFKRIFPIYWLVALIYVAVHFAIGTPFALGFSEFAGAMILLPENAGQIIGPGWTLSYELYFYLCFAVALTLRRHLAIAFLISLFMVAIVSAIVSPSAKQVLGIAGNPLLLEFLAGGAIGLAYLADFRLPTYAGFPLLILGIAGLAAGLPMHGEHYPSVLAFGVPCVPILLGMIALEPRLQGRWMSRLAYLGDSSYFLYLVHVLLIHLMFLPFMSAGFDPSADLLLLPVPIALLCTVIGAIGHQKIERPLLHVVGKITRVINGAKPRRHSLTSGTPGTETATRTTL